MLTKIKQIGTGIKNRFIEKTEDQPPAEQGYVYKDKSEITEEQPMRRKIRFDDEVQLRLQIDDPESLKKPIHEVISDDEDMSDDEKHLKLKRLFKSRAKKLIERAESLTANKLENYFEDYELEKEKEEEKEIRMSKTHSDSRLIGFEGMKHANSSRDFGIDINIDNEQEALLNQKDEELAKEEK